MAVYLNQPHRSLHQVTVSTKRESFDFLLPEGYSKSSTKYIGSGTYGIVIRTNAINVKPKRKDTVLEVAIKKIKQPVESERMAQFCYRELMLLKHLEHPNIVRLVDMYTSAQHPHELQDVYLVMEYVGSSLDKQLEESIIQKSACVPMQIVPRIIHDTLRALEYLKHARILHRDLKPANLAVHGSGKTVLIDYGLARIGIQEDRDNALTQKMGTVAYMAPEALFWQEDKYDQEDHVWGFHIWSLGCILAELITWEPLFIDAESKVDKYISLFQPISYEFLSKVPTAYNTKGNIEAKNMTIEKGNLKEYFMKMNKVANFNNPKDVAALDLFWKCVQYDPELRISINDALRHKFLADVYKEDEFYNVRSIQPLAISDKRSSIDEWKHTVFEEIWNFTPRPALF